MIKKIYFTIFLVLIFSACGKKGDPEYKEKKTKVQTTRIILVS